MSVRLGLPLGLYCYSLQTKAPIGEKAKRPSFIPKLSTTLTLVAFSRRRKALALRMRPDDVRI